MNLNGFSEIRADAPEARWMVHAKKADFGRISALFGIDPVTARVLRNRDVTTDEEIQRFLNGTVSELNDKCLLPDLEKAVDRILEAAERGSRIRIVGDYDIDGICASYILLTALKKIGAQADCVIPERIRDGYGINMRIVEECAADGIGLILTCDNGIAAVEELKAAAEKGIDVIVTDHHNIRRDEAGNELLPSASAIVNVKRSDSRYPTSEICGAVTAWKLVERLYERTGISREDWLELTEFAAVATVGDIMPLNGENRLIVREGLKRLTQGAVNTGLRMLTQVCGLEGKTVSAFHVGFVLGPCINAGGRLETAKMVLELFLTEDPDSAREKAEYLKTVNEERKNLTEAGCREAFALARGKDSKYPVLVLHLPKLHESLAGIVAGRVKEQFQKPVFVITGETDLKGSGRSVENYHMFNALCAEEELLDRFGGHPMAAGLSLKRENLDMLRERLNQHCGLTENDRIRTIWIDAAMPMGYVTMRLAEELNSLEPFGTGNPRPVFAQKGIFISGIKVLGKNRNVARMTLRDASGATFQAVMFGDGDAIAARLKPSVPASILYRPEINEYGGVRSLQMILEDFRYS